MLVEDMLLRQMRENLALGNVGAAGKGQGKGVGKPPPPVAPKIQLDPAVLHAMHVAPSKAPPPSWGRIEHRTGGTGGTEHDSGANVFQQ